jgi:hypothetical protein
MKKVTKKQAEFVLHEVAVWLGQKGLGELVCKQGRELNVAYSHVDDATPCENFTLLPAPTGPDAAYQGLGPELRMDFEPWWGGSKHPAVILESGFAPDEWAIEASYAVQDAADKKGVNVFVEPATGFILGIFPN